MIYVPWFKPDRGWFFVMFMILGTVLLCLYWIGSNKFNEQRSKYPLQAIGTVELFQSTPEQSISCVPIEQAYSAKYKVGSEVFQISLGCAPNTKFHSGQEIEIWYSRENPQLSIWADPKHKQAPSLGLLLGAIASFVLGVLILTKLKADWLTKPIRPDL